VLSIVAAILAVSLLIIVHECGHYFAARAVGMRVERFSFGFGPVLLSVRRGDTLFELRIVPIGGFVAVPMRAEPAPAAEGGAGTEGAAPVEPADPGVYANKPAWARFAFVFAGPVMNWVTAILVAWILLVFFALGSPDPSARVGQLAEGMPAAAAGLLTGDRIEAVGGVQVQTWDDLVAQIRSHPGEPIPFQVLRGEGTGAERLTLTVTPQKKDGRVGFGPAKIEHRGSALGAIPDAIHATNGNLAAQLYGFASILSRKQRAELSGPIGIAQELVRGAKAGTQRFLELVWTISVGLAVLNLLPFPGLDGSRLLFLGYELVTRRRVNERVEGLIHAAGLIVLVLLIIAVSFGDVARLLR
jgi:regulator of sigma E protease